MLMIGGLGMAIFLFIVGGIGVVNDPPASQKNTLVRLCSLSRIEFRGTDDLVTGCRLHLVYLCLQRILGAMVSSTTKTLIGSKDAGLPIFPPQLLHCCQ